MAEPITISVDGKQVTIPEARVLLGIPEGACFGCYLGDDGCDTHDTCYTSGRRTKSFRRTMPAFTEVQWKGVTYDAGMVRPRCELKTTDAAQSEFAMHAPIYGLKAEDFGKQFMSQGRIFEITGISTRSPKRPILCREVATDKNFKFTPEGVKKGLIMV